MNVFDIKDKSKINPVANSNDISSFEFTFPLSSDKFNTVALNIANRSTNSNFQL